jgi:dynein heavy chain
MRVFHDRLINTQDTTWFIDLMMELLNNNFKSGTERNDLFGETKIMFGDILKLELAGRPYEEIVGKEKLARVFSGKLEDYNSESDNRMSLVFFEDAMHHILRICRTLRQPRGNIMLIGVGGSGKQSLTRLSSYMYDMKFRMIEMKKDYKISDFRDLMKQLMFATGGVDN